MSEQIGRCPMCGHEIVQKLGEIGGGKTRWITFRRWSEIDFRYHEFRTSEAVEGPHLTTQAPFLYVDKAWEG